MEDETWEYVVTPKQQLVNDEEKSIENQDDSFDSLKSEQDDDFLWSLRALYTSPPRSVEAETDEETMPDTQAKKLKLELSEAPNVDLEQSSISDQDETTETNPMPSAVDQVIPESIAALHDIQVDEQCGSEATENRQPEDGLIEVPSDEECEEITIKTDSDDEIIVLEEVSGSPTGSHTLHFDSPATYATTEAFADPQPGTSSGTRTRSQDIKPADVKTRKEYKDRQQSHIKQDETAVAYKMQRSSLELYRQSMQMQCQGDESPHELEKLHEQILEHVLEYYDGDTKDVKKSIAEVYRGALMQEVDSHYSEFHKAAQTRVEELETSMSEGMRAARLEVTFQFEMELLEASALSDIAELEFAYSEATSRALDTFELMTDEMNEERNAPRNLLISELSRRFEILKRERCATQLDHAKRRAHDVFKTKFAAQCDAFTGDGDNSADVRDFNAARMAMHLALADFDKDTANLIKTDVRRARKHLEEELLGECSMAAEMHVVAERERGLELYRLVMSTEDIDHQLSKKRHTDTVITVMAHFCQQTKGLPASIVNPAQALLKEALNSEFDTLVKQAEKQAIAKEESILQAALSEAREGYQEKMYQAQMTHEGQGDTGSSMTDEKTLLKTTHTAGVEHALKTFNMLAHEVQSDKANTAWQELKKEFEISHVESLQRVTERVRLRQINEFVKNSQTVYTTTLANYEQNAASLQELEERHALALATALDAFDQATTHFHPADTEQHRASLVKGLEHIHREAATKQRDEQLSAEERRVHDNFTNAIKAAARDYLEWPRLQREARATALTQFEESTSMFPPEEVAMHREHLEKSIDFSLNLVKEVRKSTGDSSDCCICTDRRANLAFQPCGHVVCCENCGRSLRQCATCRGNVTGYLRLYF